MLHSHAPATLSNTLAYYVLYTNPAFSEIHLGKATSHRCWNEGQRCCLQDKNFFCCFLLLLLFPCLSFSTDLALYICSHNSEVWQRLMASNLVSLAKTWHFHMGHRGNMFERGGKRQKLGLCVCASPCPSSQLLRACKTLAQHQE